MDGSGPAPTRLAVAAAMVVVLVGATMLVVGPAATPALGCSCAGMPERQLVDAADAVFVGTVADRRAPSPDEVVSTADPVVWTFVVSKVYKGRVLARQEVVSERIGASCGLELPDRSRAWLIFASANPGGAIEVDDDQYYAGLCMGPDPRPVVHPPAASRRANPSRSPRRGGRTTPAHPVTRSEVAGTRLRRPSRAPRSRSPVLPVSP